MSSPPHLDIGERRSEQGSGRSLRSVFVAVAVFYVSGALLNGSYLYEDAQQREFGPARTVWMKATRPLAEISEFLKLHVLRDQVEKLRKE